MPDAALLAAAMIISTAGMGWLALTIRSHWEQLQNPEPLSPRGIRCLRWQGGIALFASLLLCLWVDHPTMAVLVWVMLTAAAALTIAMILSWRASWLRTLQVLSICRQ